MTTTAETYLSGASVDDLESDLSDLEYRRQVVDSSKYCGPQTLDEIDGDITRVTQELEARGA